MTRYFTDLDTLLRGNGQATPCLVLDLDRYRANIALARGRAQPGIGLRVVAKSLACRRMLDMAVDGLDAIGLMTFSAAMLDELLRDMPQAAHLLGKPLPVAAAARVLTEHPSAADRVTWLIDTPARAAQYADLASGMGTTLRVAAEVDVGLHRGGTPANRMAAEIAALGNTVGLEFAGVMGYEPHLAKMPRLLHGAAQRRVLTGLAQAGALAQEHGGTLVNTGGSMSFSQYGVAQGISEVSLGSVLVKPTDFDLPSTEGFVPALFIASPVLKYMPGNALPGLDAFRPLLSLRRRAHLAIYGGYWKARPIHPPGYDYSGVFGHSSNQEVWTGPRLEASPVDQFAFLRPTQSEAVLPEFGEIVVVEGGQVRDRWPTLPVAQ